MDIYSYESAEKFHKDCTGRNRKSKGLKCPVVRCTGVPFSVQADSRLQASQFETYQCSKCKSKFQVKRSHTDT